MLFSTEYAARRYAVFLRYPCINFSVLCLGDKGAFQQGTHPCHNKLMAEESVKSVTIHALPPWICRSRYGNSKCVLAFICLKCFSADRTGVIYKGYAVNQI